MNVLNGSEQVVRKVEEVLENFETTFPEEAASLLAMTIQNAAYSISGEDEHRFGGLVLSAAGALALSDMYARGLTDGRDRDTRALVSALERELKVALDTAWVGPARALDNRESAQDYVILLLTEAVDYAIRAAGGDRACVSAVKESAFTAAVAAAAAAWMNDERPKAAR